MRIKRSIGTILSALLLLALFFGGILFARQLTRTYAGISVRISDAPIPGKKLRRLLAQEDGALALTAAWSRGKPAAIAAAGLGTSAEARPVAVYGDISQVCPMTLLSGGFPAGTDTDGCLLTSDVAMALFHSVEAVGARVNAGGKAYTVRGVASAYEPMLVVRSESAAYENLEFLPSDLSGGAAEAEAFLYRHALSSDYTVVQSGLYAKILLGLAFLPAALACLLAAARFVQVCWPRRRKAASLWYLLPAAGALLLMLFLLERTFYWPQIYLPTKCSDFAFWGGLLADWQKAWSTMTLMTPLPKDVQFFQSARVAVCGSALTLLAVIGLHRRIGYGLRACRQTESEEPHEADR